jgi:hypothetical protein
LHKESRLTPATGCSRSEAEVTLSGVQQGEPLNGASVRFRFGLPEGWIVKLSGPFEVEVAYRFRVERSVSPGVPGVG